MLGSPLSRPPAGLVLLERVRVTAAAVQNLAFASVLDGDSDGAYYLDGYILNGAASNVIYSIEPNSLATNQYAVQTRNADGTVSGATTAFLAFLTVGANLYGFFSGVFYARKTDGTTARTRHCRIQAHNVLVAGSSINARDTAGQWNESSTNVTSLRIHADTAAGIGVGTEIRLYKILGA